MTAWPCTRQMFPAMGSPYLARMSAICWSAVFIPVILYQRSAPLARLCSCFVLTSGTAARPGTTRENDVVNLVGSHPRCLVPWFDGAFVSPEWRDALWAKF